MPYNVPDITEIIQNLSKRVSNLESATYVRGDIENTNNDPLIIQNLSGAVTFSTKPLVGEPLARIDWSWSAISSDPEDLTADVVTDYMFSVTQIDAGNVAPYSSVGTETSTVTYNIPLDTTMVGRVYAVTKSGLTGPVASLAVVVGHDVTPPEQPSTPVVSAALRGVEAYWDGLTVSLTQMPEDFAYTEVHASTSGPTFTPDATTLAGRLFKDGGTVYVLAADSSYDPIYVRLVAYDTTGNASVPSTAASASPKKLVSTDLDVALPGDIAYRDVGNLILDGSFESATMRAQRLPSFHTTGVSYDNAGGFAASGSWYLHFAGSAVTPKFLYLNGYQGIDEAPVTPDTYLYLRAKIRGISADGTINVVLRWTDGVGTQTETVLLSTATSTGAYVLFEAAAQVPSTAATVAVRVEAIAHTTGDWYIDAVELRNVVGTELIQDAAITRAKIANLAVGDAQIETLGAGKITTGILAANITVSGRIATALSGARVELNSSGLQAYDGGGSLMVNISNSGGGALLTGTYKTALSGGRVEITPGASESSVRLYTDGTPVGTVPAGISISKTPEIYSPYSESLYITAMNQASMIRMGSSITLSGSNNAAAIGIGSSGITVSGPAMELNNVPFHAVTVNAGYVNAQFGLTSTAGASLDGGNVTIGASYRLNTERIEAVQTGLLRLEPSTQVISLVTFNKTTASSVNLNISSSGYIARSTSSARYKVNIDRTYKAPLEAVKKLKPASYWDKGDAERLAALLDATSPSEDMSEFDPPRQLIGLIAEDVDALGLTDLVLYDVDGRPDAVFYDKVAVLLLPWLHQIENRLNVLEGKEA